jgi:uncharacterized protein (TIGR00304 family)
MKRLHLISLLFCILGIFFIMIGGLTGELRVGILLVFPFVVGSGPYVLVGVLSLMLALLLFILGSGQRESIEGPATSSPEESTQKPRIQGGGVVLVGPIPIIIGTSWKITLTLVLAAIGLILLVWFLFYYTF